jgi:hypothetical protein
MVVCPVKRICQVIKYFFEEATLLFNGELIKHQKHKIVRMNYLLTFSISMASPVIVPVIVTLSPI